MSESEITAEFAVAELNPETSPTAPRRHATVAMGAKSDLGRARENNEDKFDWLEPDDAGLLAARGRLYAVADGMGGHAAGQIASEIALKTVLRSFFSSRSGEPSAALAESIRAANALVWETGHRIPGRSGMGTTVTALVVHEDRALIGQVGDSRAYLLRDGAIERITEDHSWVAEQVKARLMTEEQAERSPYRNVITRSIGAEETVEPDLFELTLQPGDRFLLCSDGLSGVVTPEEMKEAMESGSPSVAAWRLIDLANDRGGPDNVTCMILRIGEIVVDPEAETGEEEGEEGVRKLDVSVPGRVPEKSTDSSQASEETAPPSPDAAPSSPRRKNRFGWRR
jgi:protein phosphatase